MQQKILRLKKVQEVTGCSKSFIYRHMRLGNFPGRVRLAVRAVGWYQSDIEEWMNSRERIGQYPCEELAGLHSERYRQGCGYRGNHSHLVNQFPIKRGISP